MAHVSRATADGSIIMLALSNGESQFRPLGDLPADTVESRIGHATRTNTTTGAHFAPPEQAPVRLAGGR